MTPTKAVAKPASGKAHHPTARQAAAAALAAKFPQSRLSAEFGGGSLTIDNKVFAFTSRNDRVVMKLPAERIETLIDTGHAERLTMGKRTMREWVVIADAASPATLELLSEALAFVKSLPPAKPKKNAAKKKAPK